MNKRIFIALFFTVFCAGLFAQNSSVLAQGDWYKISTTKNGIYKISYSSVVDLGIDVNNLAFVIHYQLPEQLEYYTHRSGRTARAGKSGFSIALILPNEINRIQEIQKELGIKFLEITV